MSNNNNNKANKTKKVVNKLPVSKPNVAKDKSNINILMKFTKSSMNVVEISRQLTMLLKKNYGDEVTIHDFEIAMIEFVKLPNEDQKSLILFDPECVKLYDTLKTLREKRDDERKTFKSEVSLNRIEFAFDSIKKFGIEHTKDK
jgi:hypothetical protein